MAYFSIQDVAIKGISAVVPKTSVSNRDLEEYSQEEMERLVSVIGIEHRRVAAGHQCASDLCVAAAEKLITELNWDKKDIDVLFFVTQTPDYSLPGSSMHMVERLGLTSSCASFDINQGCAGYVYGLSLISSFMSAGKIKKGLLVVGDTITKLISPLDKSLLPIFSDAGTATALELDMTATKMTFNTSTFGRDYESIIVPKGGSRFPLTENSFEYKIDESNNQRKEFQLVMKGMNVFTFSIGKVAPHVKELLAKAEQNSEEIHHFVFHQANRLILESISEKLKIEKSKVPSSLKNYGNTSGATIPLTIVTELGKEGRIPDSTMLLSGFGVGLSMASAIVNFKGVICPKMIEV
jgi:3-oxoacyl-[acyl-carrier-protein] synthase III